MLRFEDRWIWDFWTARHDGVYHVFYLQAPRSLGDADLRHANATVGHAVSEDLRRWTVVGDALGPGDRGTWDEMATWTGSIIRNKDTWYMFYTGAAKIDGLVSQQVGAAVSQDLTSWDKLPGPMISPDPRWYETLERHDWFEEAWRDPWVFKGSDGVFHALITARSNEGPRDGRGVIGHATSPDLFEWEVRPPLSSGGEFGHLEVSQLVTIADRHLLVFSCQEDLVSPMRQERLGEHPGDRTYLLEASSELGPFDIARARPALTPDFYSGRLVETFNGDWVWLAFHNFNNDGSFLGELSDPIPFAQVSQ